ncbi:MAG: IS21 family transposase [Deltaproteobacteria bacterium]|nr:IS21 family transposase [Deltaproteobacteria bacterium]
MKITQESQQAILSLYQRGVQIRQISQILKLSRNTVRRVLRGKWQERPQRASPYEELSPLIREVFNIAQGNVVRVQEILQDQYGHSVPYSTLTRIVQSLDLREEKKKQRSGTYVFGPGQEMQHDTSPHGVLLDGKKVKAQCAGLVLGYSRKLFIQYYPSFTRFEARVFLDEAFKFMDGTCPSCIIDNTSVLVAHGSGPGAEIAPEMERFGQIFGVKFIPHAIGDADRKAKMERNFFYVERNFLAGRTFTDWQDLNEQAKRWCMEIANQKVKRSLGISPEAAYLMEKPHLTPLPPYIPPVYQTIYRTGDVAGYVQVDTNRYSVPERLIGKEVEVHKLWDRVEVFFKNQKVADHPRLIDKRETRITTKGHHPPFNRERAHGGPCTEEKILLGQQQWLDPFIEQLKKRSSGRGVMQLRRLLDLKRTYPPEAFEKAVVQALRYGLYDLPRLEQMILSHVQGDFFTIEEDEEL